MNGVGLGKKSKEKEEDGNHNFIFTFFNSFQLFYSMEYGNMYGCMVWIDE